MRSRTVMRLSLGFVITSMFIGITFAACDAHAAEPDKPSAQAPLDKEQTSRFIGHGEVIGRANPGSVTLITGGQYRLVLKADERGERAYLQGGAALVAGPSYVAPRFHAEAMPHPILTLRAEYDVMMFAGANRGLLSFRSADAPFGETVLEHKEASSGHAQRAAFQIGVKNQLGPVQIRSKTTAAYYHFGGGVDEGKYFYHPELDTLLERNDLALTSRTEVLLAPWKSGRHAGLFLGPVLESTYVVRSELSRHRLGGTVAFVAADQWGMFYKPSLQADIGANLNDPNREGEAYANFGISTMLQ